MDIISIIACALFMLLVMAAVIKLINKKRRGESVHITLVGVNKGLPSEVTGINKYDE